MKILIAIMSILSLVLAVFSFFVVQRPTDLKYVIIFGVLSIYFELLYMQRKD